MTNEQLIKKWIKAEGKGVEIGAFLTPLPVIKPYYVDYFEEYAGAKCLLDFKGDACSLPFKDCSLDYVATSHVIEHVANPIQALAEWVRVLVDGGIIYMVVPDRRKTWDRKRPATLAKHMLEDFRKGVAQNDPTHVQDFSDGIIWSEFAPGQSEDDRLAYRKVLEDSTAAGLEINIHFHTFEPSSFSTVIDSVNHSGLLSSYLRINEIVEDFPSNNPNGFLVVLTVEGGVAKKTKSFINSCLRYFSKDWPVHDGIVRYRR